MDKHDVAKVLDEIASLLELVGENPFKVRAFLHAAREIENTSDDVHDLVREGRLQTLPGIGEKIAEKITTLVQTGHLPYLEELQKKVPQGVLTFLTIPGLGAKRAKVLYEELGLKTLEELQEAAKNGLIARLPGFGNKIQENILHSLKMVKSYSARHLWWSAMQQVQPILEGLKALKGVHEVEVAGSLRRKLETVGDLDLLVSTIRPQEAMDWFVSQPWVESIITHGSTKSSVRLKKGVQAELRAVSREQFAFALLYYTGSKDHNIAIRRRANSRGLSLNEYGFQPLKRGSKVPRLKKRPTEAEIYKSLGLEYIPPELREDLGEIEAAEEKRLPKLIVDKEIRGAFHCHTTASDGHNNLEEMVAAAQALSWHYIGIADHSKSSVQANGLSEERLFEQVEAIRKIDRQKRFKTHVFAGSECDIMTNGDLDFADDVLQALDYVVVSIHRSFSLSKAEMTKRLIRAIENPYSTIVGHLTGRMLLKREGYALDVDKVIDACIANGKIMELNAQPMRLDMDWRYWHKALQKGLKCMINPDAHRACDLELVRAGVNVARKGWLRKEDVVNTLTLGELKKLLKTIRRGSGSV